MDTPSIYMSNLILNSCIRIKKDDYDVVTNVNYGVALFPSWAKSICNGEMGITRIRAPPTTIASFRR